MAVRTYIISFFAAIWRWIGNVCLPVWHNIVEHEMGWLIIAVGTLVLFILGIVLQANGWKEHTVFDELEKIFDLPDWVVWPVAVMRVFYPLLTVYISMELVKNTAFATSFVGINYTLYNYTEWTWYDQVIGAIVVLEFLVLSLLCILRLKPKRLIRFWVHTIDFILIGYLIGSFILLMQELTEGVFLLAFIVFMFGLILDVVVPVIFSISALAPV